MIQITGSFWVGWDENNDMVHIGGVLLLENVFYLGIDAGNFNSVFVPSYPLGEGGILPQLSKLNKQSP